MAEQISEELIISIRAQVEQAIKSLRSVQESLGKTEKDATKTAKATDTMASSMIRRAKQIVGAYLGFKTLLEGIKFNAFIEQTQTAFGVMLRSSAAATSKVEELLQFSLKIPLTFRETIDASRQLLAYGFAAEDLTKELRMLGDVATAIGAPLGDLAYIYGTLRSQGRAYARDLMQFGMRGIPIYEELRKVVGETTDSIQKLTEEGKIGFKEVQKAFQNMTGEGGRFSNLMDKLMNTLVGAWRQFRGVFEVVLGDLTKNFSDNLVPILREATNWLIQNRESFKEFGVVIGTALTAALKALLALVKELWNFRYVLLVIAGIWATMKLKEVVLVLLSMATAIDGVTGAFTALSLSVGGFTALILGPFAAAAGVVFSLRDSMIQWSIDIAKFFGLSEQEANRQLKAYGLLKNEVDKFYDTQADVGVTRFLENQKRLNEALEDQKKIAAELQDEFKKFRDNYNKYLAERARDEEGQLDALVLYEQRKQEDLAKEKLGANKTLHEEALRMIQEQYSYEAAQLKKQAEYKRIEISREVTGFSSILDQEKTATMYEEEALTAMGNKHKALAQEYGIRRASLEQLQRIVAEEEQRVQYGLQLNVSTENTLALLKAQHPALAADEKAWAAITKAIQDIPVREQLEKVEQSLGNQLERSRDFSERLKIINELFKTRIELIKLLLDPQQREIENAQAVYEWNKATTDELSKQYDLLVRGNDEYFSRLKSQAMEQIKAGDLEKGLGSAAQVGLQGTQVGTLMSSGENAGTSAMLQLVASVVEAAQEFEVLRDILNPFAVIAKAIFAVLGPVLSTVLKPLVSIFKVLGNIIGAVTYIFLAMSPILKNLQFALESVANAFRWFYNSIIVPVGNAIIDFTNAIIDGINFLLGWLGVHIDHLDKLVTITDNLADDLEAAQKRLQEVNDALDYLKNKLKEAVDAQIESLKDLYQVGAITASQYEVQVRALNATYGAYFMDDLDVQYSQLTTLTQILNAIKALLGEQQQAEEAATAAATLQALKQQGASVVSQLASQGRSPTTAFIHLLDKSQQELDALGAFLGMGSVSRTGSSLLQVIQNLLSRGVLQEYSSDRLSDLKDTIDYYIRNGVIPYASGVSSVPNNMLASLHKGETVIPRNFAEALRKGELTISGPGGNYANGGNTYYTVNIEGSMIEERGLVTVLDELTRRERKRGHLVHGN